ncbi:HlyD family secretion protein [Shewanella schlegeliana]|uniref:HlyD family secretion protein n=1 Tax=Shewanella schlegeliana TaxID=190308 RepID=A0ABS1SVV8_9GAMM|nr:HlyD family secretion protein [Shewanella schlegeliana]MBL4912652.1 HlyD family secretion protein [Shewanella schlegeliana]MCL1109838.1 HlyD family secretion protein [Shewanella schlegeliana]GIU32784.1 multidrug transporter [Shewanella schlegeliana]
MQTAEHAFRRWMQSLIIIFIILVGYIVIADRYAPLTTESRVQGYVIQIAPEVTGTVTDVQVSNNQKLKKGEKLFSIDKRKYMLAVEKAQLALVQAQEQEDSMYAKVEAAEAKVATNQATFDNANSEYKRISKLAKQKLVSVSMLDNALANNTASKANLRAAQQELRALTVQLGSQPGKSSVVRAAKNNLRQAQLNLSHTQVVAPSDGIVTNLQLEVGSTANSNMPLLTFIPTDSLWVAADFREKAVARINRHSRALVAFDAFPGKVFNLVVQSRDFGVAAAQQSPNGQLTHVETSNRWVRDAQRVRINLTCSSTLPQPLFVGSRATVVLYPADDRLWAWLAKIQIQLVSWLHYIY